LVNVGVGLVLAGALAAPILAEVGYSSAAASLHQLYLLLCPQRPSHSYYLLGQQLALEEREMAMFTAQLLSGIVYGYLRGRVRMELPSPFFAGSAVPLAWDVLSQMLALRSSDWFTRSWTGGIFMIAFVFWCYPPPGARRVVRRAARLDPLSLT
jgi:uncharacterized membrane protein